MWLSHFLLAKQLLAYASDGGVVRLARWCGGYSIRFAVGKLEIHFPSRGIPKDFKKFTEMIFTDFPLGAEHNRDSVENKPTSCL